ncbi:hypothetical protein O9992_21840 [Vibrio lentus]|nr:hypothetical protein [Vibrio lentus]
MLEAAALELVRLKGARGKECANVNQLPGKRVLQRKRDHAGCKPISMKHQ